MTRMIPPVIAADTKSRAERRMFEIIRDAPRSDRWVCVHSLALAAHERKRRAEADFVLLTHHGVFVLEVKGGGIKRTNGTWYQVGRDDKTNRLKESPFEQAAGAMFALEKRIKERFREQPQAKALFGYGVVFPDTVFDLDSPESDRRLVYDLRDRERGFDAYVNRLAEFAREAEQREKRPMLKPEAIDEGEVEHVHLGHIGVGVNGDDLLPVAYLSPQGIAIPDFERKGRPAHRIDLAPLPLHPAES